MKKLETNGKQNKNASKEKVEDLSKFPKYTLLEMLDRQNKLLSNRSAVEKLKDKGAKIIRTKKQIEDELEKRVNASTNLCEVMAGLKLSTSQINALEWTQNTKELNREKFKEEEKESEKNPFKILATHSGTVFSKRTVKIEEQPESLITEKDIEEIYAAKLCDKIDKVEPTSRFLPHKTLNQKFCSKKSLSDYKKKDLCSASQPPSKFDSIIPISLEASIRLQYEQTQHLKDVQLKHAAERLKDKAYTIGNVLPSHEKLKPYRNPALIDSGSECDDEDDEEEIQEVEDDCAGDEDTEGTVTYRVIE
uniref:Putative dna-directed rna polymerase ii subunit grinl1a-like protein n=1 Tax=Triatoma dimidiata TaxID=72491 RepID=A0A0V0G968_TRIDM